jgi:glycosyltransferase involved in cell wall biosynthesis
MDEPIKISAVVITFNEEKNIDRCLDTLKSVADEIIVVDSYSADRTEEICKTYNVRFVKRPFDGHIQQKNHALALSSFPYVLSLDADEALSDKMTQKILEIKKDWQHDAYSFNRLTNYCGKWIYHCGWYPDTKIRLWDKRKGQWGGENPHDRVHMVPASSLQHLHADLLHYSYYTISQHLQQVDYFTEIMAKEAFRLHKKSTFLNILVSPLFKFIKSYLFKLGFLDGYYGFVVCMISAHATFIKHVKVRELYKTALNNA